MGKHKTSASLGALNNYVSTPEHEETPDNVFERVNKLERRVATLEGLLNDVMIQLDKPVRNQSFGNGDASNQNLQNNPKSKSKHQEQHKPQKQKRKLVKSSDPEIMKKRVGICKTALLEELKKSGGLSHKDLRKTLNEGVSSPVFKTAIRELKSEDMIFIKDGGIIEVINHEQ